MSYAKKSFSLHEWSGHDWRALFSSASIEQNRELKPINDLDSANSQVEHAENQIHEIWRIYHEAHKDLFSGGFNEFSKDEIRQRMNAMGCLFYKTLLAQKQTALLEGGREHQFSPADLKNSWVQLVQLYYRKSPVVEQEIAKQKGLSQSTEPVPEGAVNNKELSAFLRTLLVPLLITKAIIFYFGINYVLYPGEGYGYGLAISICVTLFNFIIFIWKRRNETYD